MKHTRIHGMRIEKIFKNGNIAFTFKISYFKDRVRGRYIASTRVLKCPDYCGYGDRLVIREQLNLEMERAMIKRRIERGVNGIK